ncbi:hypothetical protein CT0861_07141, partial [Colletotrichum tofieldiae]
LQDNSVVLSPCSQHGTAPGVYHVKHDRGDHLFTHQHPPAEGGFTPYVGTCVLEATCSAEEETVVCTIFIDPLMSKTQSSRAWQSIRMRPPMDRRPKVVGGAGTMQQLIQTTGMNRDAQRRGSGMAGWVPVSGADSDGGDEPGVVRFGRLSRRLPGTKDIAGRPPTFLSGPLLLFFRHAMDDHYTAVPPKSFSGAQLRSWSPSAL